MRVIKFGKSKVYKKKGFKFSTRKILSGRNIGKRSIFSMTSIAIKGEQGKQFSKLL